MNPRTGAVSQAGSPDDRAVSGVRHRVDRRL